MYVAVKGGERAIDAAHQWLAEERRGDPSVTELSVAQIREQMGLAVARVMGEGSVFDPDLAALAIKQARGDLVEAAFLLRAYRTTLPRFGAALPVDTAEMAVTRRISATYKDIPGGQILGPTFDYTHRLLDFQLAAEGAPQPEPAQRSTPKEDPVPHVLEMLNQEGLIEPASAAEAPNGGMDSADDDTPDLTRDPLSFPANRALRLQAMARGDEGFLLSLAYSTQRGFGRTHAFVGELRVGDVDVSLPIPELGIDVSIGTVSVTECETVNQFQGSKTEPPQFTRGYGLVFGQAERKALSISLVDRALRWRELGEDDVGAPAQDEEFVLSHVDNIQATGFLEHIKLPHYVDFQSELELVRRLRIEVAESLAASESGGDGAANGDDGDADNDAGPSGVAA